MVATLFDLPTIINNALLGGSVATLAVAKLIIDLSVIMAVALPLLYLGANLWQFIAIEFLVAGTLTAFGWMDVGLMIIFAIAIAGPLAYKGTTVMLGQQNGGGGGP